MIGYHEYTSKYASGCLKCGKVYLFSGCIPAKFMADYVDSLPVDENEPEDEIHVQLPKFLLTHIEAVDLNTVMPQLMKSIQ